MVSCEGSARCGTAGQRAHLVVNVVLCKEGSEEVSGAPRSRYLRDLDRDREPPGPQRRHGATGRAGAPRLTRRQRRQRHQRFFVFVVGHLWQDGRSSLATGKALRVVSGQ